MHYIPTECYLYHVHTELVLPPLANTSSTKHAITIISHSLSWLAFSLIQQSGFTHALIHAIFASQFSLPPPTHDSLLLHQLHIQGGHLHRICQRCHLVCDLHFLMRKWWRHPWSALFFWDQFKLYPSTGHFTCIFTVAISKPYAEWRPRFAEVRSGSLQLNIFAS